MKGTLSTSQYSVAKTEVQTSVMDWIQAIEEFHRNYFKINEVLEDSKSARPKFARSTAVSRRVDNLVKLRRYMNDVLQTLLLDMTKSTVVPFYHTGPMKSSKTGQLMTHAQLLDDLNRKICKELSYFTTAQA